MPVKWKKSPCQNWRSISSRASDQLPFIFSLEHSRAWALLLLRTERQLLTTSNISWANVTLRGERICWSRDVSHIDSKIQRGYSGESGVDRLRNTTKVQANWSAALQTLEGHSNRVSSVAFSPDGQLVVSGSCGQTVRLWDTVTGALQQALDDHSNRVSSVAFSADGKALGLCASNEWIVEGGIKILWLPPGYRATSVAIWNSSVVLGHSSKNILCLKLTQELKLI